MSVSRAGRRSSRRSGAAARRCGRSKWIRLWPRMASAGSAKSSSSCRAPSSSRCLSLVRTRDLPLESTAANALIRSFRLPTSRSIARYRIGNRVATRYRERHIRCLLHGHRLQTKVLTTLFAPVRRGRARPCTRYHAGVLFRPFGSGTVPSRRSLSVAAGWSSRSSGTGICPPERRSSRRAFWMSA